jgi:hypothetical protein
MIAKLIKFCTQSLATMRDDVSQWRKNSERDDK